MFLWFSSHRKSKKEINSIHSIFCTGLVQLSVLLDNFFFIVSKGGPKEKCWKIAKTMHGFWVFFSFGPVLETMKKSCLKGLKSCEVLENPKSNICWKFQLFISKTGKSPPKSISVFPIWYPLSKWLKICKTYLVLPPMTRIWPLSKDTAPCP